MAYKCMLNVFKEGLPAVWAICFIAEGVDPALNVSLT